MPLQKTLHDVPPHAVGTTIMPEFVIERQAAEICVATWRYNTEPKT